MDISHISPADALMGYAKRRVPFETAIDALIQQGYIEADLRNAAEQLPYDLMGTDVNPDNQRSSVTLAAAQAVGNAALNDRRVDDRDVAIADGLAAEFAPDIQSGAYYESQFMEDIGIPWQAWTLVPIGFTGLVYWLHLPGWLLSASCLLSVGYVGYKFYGRFRKRA